jgi:hypothetical protein
MARGSSKHSISIVLAAPAARARELTTEAKRGRQAAAWALAAVLQIATALAMLALSAGPARAQGCIIDRTNGPAFSTADEGTFTRGEWQLFFNYRQSTADDHYNGTQFQYQRKELVNYVINTQQLYNLGLSYNFTERFSVFSAISVVNASFSFPSPFASNGPRREQNASNVGDLAALGRWWLLNPHRHMHGNIAAAFGIKAPTGKYGVEDEYPDIDGTNNTSKAVDQSIQPGDGGWGMIFDLQGYRSFKHVAFYGSGTYTANPRDTNGTPSIIVGVGLGGNPAFADLLENSVPDQYVARTGALFPIARKPLSLSLGFRVEGVPRYDLFGDSHGWRRPGYETFIEPGILWTHRSSTFSLQVPRGIVRNRRPNPYTGNPGDATFPDWILIAGYSHRFGAGAAALRPTPPALPPGPDIPHGKL